MYSKEICVEQHNVYFTVIAQVLQCIVSNLQSPKWYHANLQKQKHS